jgi:hypothetical protein
VKFDKSKHERVGDSVLIVDYQKVDDWYQKSVTVKIYETGLRVKKTGEYWDHACWDAFVIDDQTGTSYQRAFVGEEGYNEANRWSNDLALNTLYLINK